MRTRTQNALAALLCCVAPLLGAAPATAAAAGAPVRITMAPAGVSFEYPTLAQALGAGPCPPPALVAELERLGSPPLQLGGDSQDLTAPAGALSPQQGSWTASTLYQLPGEFWSRLRCLLGATHEPLTVGLNAKTGTPAWAAQMLAAAQGAAVAGMSVSIGNEPDLYALPDYASLGTRIEPGDPALVQTYERVAAGLRPAIGAVPLIAPELAAAAHWRGSLARVVAALHAQVLGVHAYPLSGCRDPRGATLAALLSARAADAPRRIAWVAGEASALRLPAIITEANSISCGGKPGVSDSPGSAVWAVRFTLSALASGFREVRFHFSGGIYDAFTLLGARVLERPLARAMTLLNRWLPPGALLRRTVRADGVVETAVGALPGGSELILDNEAPIARTLALPARVPFDAQQICAARPGLAVVRLRPRGRTLRVVIAPDCVIALVPARP